MNDGIYVEFHGNYVKLIIADRGYRYFTYLGFEETQALALELISAATHWDWADD